MSLPVSVSFATRALGWAAALFLRALAATWRYAVEGPDPLTPGHPPVVAAFWHRNVLVACWAYRARGFGVAVSRSRDGDRIAALLRALGYGETPRGSSSRGGPAALRDLVAQVEAGSTVSIQPDGPQGPAREAKVGVVTLARLTGRPVTPVVFSASPALRFRSWDGTLLPLPFARVVCRYADPIEVPADADEEEEERCRLRLEQAMNAETEALDERLGLEPRA